MNNDETEYFAIAQGVYNALGDIVATGNPDNLRGRIDSEIYADAAKHKKTTVELYIGDKYVGCISPVESKESTRIIVEDGAAALQDIMYDIPLDELPQDIVLKIAEWYFKKTGAVPNGCSSYTEPKRIASTKVSGCDPNEVSAVLGMNLPQAIVHLLGAGGEE